jgi:RNA ligase (TIGR02306 family)
VNYDIENFKKFPHILVEGEEVIFTEKLHGSFCGVGVLPRHDCDPKHYKDEFVIFSKGLGSQGLCFKNVLLNQDNSYIRALEDGGVLDKLRALRNEMEEDGGFEYPLFLLGEVYGGSIQAGFSYGDTPKFRMFDVCAGYRGDQHYFDVDAKQHLANHLEIDTVPLLYRGPFSKEIMYEYTEGDETVSGKAMHIREGIVVNPVEERYDLNIGRVILKSVSATYLLRKGKTTEYQ